MQKKVPPQNHNANFVKPFPPVVKVGVGAWGGFKAERKKVPSTSRQRLQFFSSDFDAWREGFLEDFSVFSGWYLFSQTPDSEICVVSPQAFGYHCRLVYSIESKTEVSPRHVVSACSNQGLGACTLRLATVHFKRFHLTGSLQGFLGWEQESPQGFWGGNPQRTVPDGP